MTRTDDLKDSNDPSRNKFQTQKVMLPITEHFIENQMQEEKVQSKKVSTASEGRDGREAQRRRDEQTAGLTVMTACTVTD